MTDSRWWKRRTVWAPTWRTGLLGIAAIALVTLAVGAKLHAFLSPNAPIAARTLVVEGWLPLSALDAAADRFARGGYERLVTTGGPVERWAGQPEPTTYAEVAAAYLVARGLDAAKIESVPAPASAQNRTFVSAVVLRESPLHARVRSGGYDLVSLGAHARRSRDLYRQALGPDVALGVIALAPSAYDADQWWRSSAGARTVISEFIGWLWVVGCFSPGDPGSHEELWGRPPLQPDTHSSEQTQTPRLESPPGIGGQDG